jgi:hypothetical protein
MKLVLRALYVAIIGCSIGLLAAAIINLFTRTT